MLASFILCIAVLGGDDDAQAKPQPAGSFEVGAKILVVRETPLRVDNRVVETLPPGTPLRVEENQDGYLGVTVDRQGWVDQNDVAPAEQAVEALGPAIANDHDNIQLHEARLRYAGWQKKWDVALTDCNELIRLEPNEPGHLLERAYALAHQGKYDAAVADCDELVRQDWHPGLVLFYRGWLWDGKHQLVKAIADYDEALKHETDAEHRSKILLYRGIANRKQGDWEKALSDFTEAIKLNSKNAEIFKERAYLYFRLERHSEAVTDYSAALYVSPNNPDLYAVRGESYRMSSDFDRALADFDRALELDPQHEFAYRSRGNLYVDKRDNDKALADFEASLRIDPESAQTYASCARLYMKIGELEKAEVDIDKAIKCEPESANSWYARAQLMQKKKKYDEVKTAYQNAIRYSPADVTLCNNFAWFLATCPEGSARDGEAALRLAKKAAQMCENREPATLGTLAAAYAETGDFEAAIQWLDRAMKADIKGKYREQHEAHRKLYLQHKPYHSTASN